MPSFNRDTKRLPSRAEARTIAATMVHRAETNPDADEKEWLVVHLLRAYAHGRLVMRRNPKDEK